MANDILIVDDEADICKLIAGILEDEGYETREAGSSSEAFSAIEARQPSLIILDVWLQNSQYDGLQMLEIIRRDNPDQQVLMISGHATFDMAVRATKMGAYDFLTKPFKSEVLLHTISRAVEDNRLRRENLALQKQVGDRLSDLTGNSPAIAQLRQALEKVAPTDSRVLITGSPGSGKSVVAQLLHDNSARASGPFVVLNCAGLEPDRLETELFGVEATDKSARSVGVLEQAHGGTLLLDEVADMPLETQAKIVRVLHKPRFNRIGGAGWVEVDVRVIATTNRDLTREIEAGLFREDLYYRLNVVPLTVPPLGVRRADIPELSTELMARAASSKGHTPRVLSEEALIALQAYEWPGNVWELVNVIERLLLPSVGDLDAPVGADAVAEAIGGGSPEFLRSDASLGIMNQPLREAREDFERQYLTFHLARFGGNISRTAGFVGMDRAALHRKLKGLGVHNSERAQKTSA
jgi:two-component system, NtrC family, nitrogen regulation response regulator NtrX